MNIAEYAIRKKAITITMTILALIGGTVSYLKLSRLEDPEFTIKQAQVTTEYPGASAREVAEEISDKIEKAAQQLGQLDKVESKSTRNSSIVTVEMKDKFDKHTLPQVWDELRRKVMDAQSQLPDGAETSVVIDDFGDVYGMYFAITGDGYNYTELREVAKFLQRELLQVQDVKKIELWGVQSEAVYVSMSREKMAALGISPQQIYTLLAAKNMVANAGKVKVGDEYIPIAPSGGITAFEQLGNLLISKDGGRLIFLKDVASITRGYIDPPEFILRYNGKPAIALAVSTVLGGNVVTMGDALQKRLKELTVELPVGVEVSPISIQSETVKAAVNDFAINLLESVVIVVLVLLIFMGLRSGLLIGFVLLVTVAVTFVVMEYCKITLERISLGALIIALGMLVDNAIVITEGMMVKIEKGEDRLQAAKDIVGQTMWPLFGATAIAIIAFGSIGLSEDSTGEFCRSLFLVLLISLSASWVTAVTLTPLLCYWIFKKRNVDKSNNKVHDPYNAWLFRVYRNSLDVCLKHRWLSCGVMAGLLATSIYGFGFVEHSFFPNSTRAQFFLEIWHPHGTHISETARTVKDIEAQVRKIPGVTMTAAFIGGGANRFILTYAPEKTDSSYAMMLVSVDDWTKIEKITDNLQRQLDAQGGNYMVNVRKFLLGPGDGGKIQVRFSGRDHEKLRQIADEAMAVMRSNPNTKAIHSDWREKVKVIRPKFSETQASQVGVTYHDVSNALRENFEGVPLGVFREDDELLPIIARSPDITRMDVCNIENTFIWSNSGQKMIPVDQVVNGFETVWENPIVMRRHRMPTITIHCDPARGLASDLLAQLRPKLEAISLPSGYKLEYGGEYEDSNKANAGLAKSIPGFAVLMFLMVVFLFNSFRHPLVIWLTVPMTVIGVTFGLLVFRQPFGFMALLGFLSLSGMQIKNAIILLDEINCQIATGKAHFSAILDSSVSRIRPVTMAAFTTVLGMLPLLTDAFFVSMAVTIMFGLSFACVLTLYVVPVFYSIFFGIKYGE